MPDPFEKSISVGIRWADMFQRELMLALGTMEGVATVERDTDVLYHLTIPLREGEDWVSGHAALDELLSSIATIASTCHALKHTDAVDAGDRVTIQWHVSGLGNVYALPALQSSLEGTQCRVRSEAEDTRCVFEITAPHEPGKAEQMRADIEALITALVVTILFRRPNIARWFKGPFKGHNPGGGLKLLNV